MRKAATVPPPPAKKKPGDFRCYLCRETFSGRDGTWVPWQHMQVHLCHSCERESREVPERKTS